MSWSLFANYACSALKKVEQYSWHKNYVKAVDNMVIIHSNSYQQFEYEYPLFAASIYSGWKQRNILLTA